MKKLFHWTGGQYSLFRILVAVMWVAAVPTPAVGVAALLLVMGHMVRFAAAYLTLLAWVTQSFVLLPATFYLLMLPADPYLSIASIHRMDPRGNWHIGFAECLLGWLLLICSLSLGKAWVWIPFVLAPIPARTESAIVFYDGTCALCHGLVRFCLAEAPRDTLALRFSPLQGITAKRYRLGTKSIAVVRDGVILKEGKAIFFILESLGGTWRAASWVLRLLPMNVFYRFIARVRYKVFGRKQDSCPLITNGLEKYVIEN